MSLLVPSFNTAYRKSAPFENVIAWMAALTCDFASMTGRVVLNVNTDATSAQDGSSPVDQVGITLGQTFPTGEKDADGNLVLDENGQPTTVTFPDLAKIITDNQEHFDAIREYLYGKLKYMPMFKNSIDV
jgi:hypothetical protein